MYSYTYDKSTGGILLNPSPTKFSKEPRPVYAPELDIFGLDQYWNYDKQTDFPYMWAEANRYYYRGTLVAKLKGGDFSKAPEVILSVNKKTGETISPEPDGMPLRPVDIGAMLEANRELLETIEQVTVKRILDVYTEYEGKLDGFHVAFSGGKDSCVLLDLVKKTLPKNSFWVIFGDTGMEFPETYCLIEKIKQQCAQDGISFYTAKSHLDAKESWKLFGFPSRTARWCCSVHKSAPQILKIREITGRNKFVGFDFVGSRMHESFARSKYDYLIDSKKIEGQFGHNSILDWTSAEVWLYIYANNILINEAYKKGKARVGCIICPMGGGRSEYLERELYNIMDFIEIIKNSNNRKIINMEEYLQKGGWRGRKNGRDLINNPNRYFKQNDDENLNIVVLNPSSDWREWIKTIDINKDSYTVEETETGYIATLKEKNRSLGKLFKQVFHKVAYCIGCRVCEANCVNGALRFVDNKVKINNCIKCKKCHSVYTGCLVYQSRRHPKS